MGRSSPENTGVGRDEEKIGIYSNIQIILHAVCLGPSLEEKLLVSCDISASGQEHIKINPPEAGHQAIVPGSSKNCPVLMAHNGGAVDGCVSGPTTAEAEKASDQTLSKEESGELLGHGIQHTLLTDCRSDANTLSIDLKMGAA